MNGSVGTKRNTVSCGRDLDCVVNLQHELHSASSTGFNFVCFVCVLCLLDITGSSVYCTNWPYMEHAKRHIL